MLWVSNARKAIILTLPNTKTAENTHPLVSVRLPPEAMEGVNVAPPLRFGNQKVAMLGLIGKYMSLTVIAET